MSETLLTLSPINLQVCHRAQRRTGRRFHYGGVTLLDRYDHHHVPTRYAPPFTSGIRLEELSRFAVKWGMGQHISTLPLNELIESQKPFYVSVFVYNLSMSCTKFSILLQYLRIFPQQKFRIACYILMGVVGIYTCWTFFSAVFACSPISYFWTQFRDLQGGHCLNRFAVW